MGSQGREVRCTRCGYEWFQKLEAEPEEMPSFASYLEAEEEPIPESVRPLPEGSDLPSLIVAARPVRPTLSGAMAGYLAAGGVFVVLTGILFGFHGPVSKVFPPAAGIFSLAGLETPLPEKTLSIDRVEAEAFADDNGAYTLTVKGAIVNLTGHAASLPTVKAILLNEGGEVAGDLPLEIAQADIGAYGDMAFEASYPNMPADLKTVTVKFVTE